MTSPAVDSPLAAMIRDATAPLHALLESELPFHGDDLTTSRYVGVLAAFHGFIAPWERARDAALTSAHQAFFADRSHAPRLRRDLRAVGVTDVATLPQCAALPALRSAAAALGSAYVIEGSTLGGRIISAMVRRQLGLDATRGCAYFAGYGDDNGRRWREFRAYLEANVPTAQRGDAVDGARETFRALHAWLVARAPRHTVAA